MRWCVLSAWIALLGLGCGATPEAEPEPAPPSNELPAPEAFEIRLGERIELGGVPIWFSGATPPGEGSAVVSLTIGRGSRRTVSVFRGGCAELDGFVYAIESLSASEEPVARMQRAPVASAPLSLVLGRDENVAAQRAMRADELTLRVSSVYPFDDGGYGVVLNAVLGTEPQRELQLSGNREPTEHPLGDGRILRLSIPGARDPLGCPLLRVALIDPDREVITGRVGAEVRIRRNATLVVGELRVRYRGWMEAALADGTHEQYADLEVSRGDAVERRSCPLGGSIEVVGHVVEALRADPSSATLRIRPSR